MDENRQAVSNGLKSAEDQKVLDDLKMEIEAQQFYEVSPTVCPRSLYPICVVTYFITYGSRLLGQKVYD